MGVTCTAGASAALAEAHANTIAASAAIAFISHPLDGERDALADADAKRGERKPAARLFELMQRGQREARAAHAERMAQRDRAAIGIHMAGIIRQAKAAQHCERLARERFI